MPVRSFQNFYRPCWMDLARLYSGFHQSAVATQLAEHGCFASKSDMYAALSKKHLTCIYHMHISAIVAHYLLSRPSVKAVCIVSLKQSNPSESIATRASLSLLSSAMAISTPTLPVRSALRSLTPACLSLQTLWASTMPYWHTYMCCRYSLIFDMGS